jgi:hypothetical protein
MTDIRKFAVSPTSRLELLGPDDLPLLTEDGLPMAVNLYGPGSKENQRAQTKKSNALVERLRRKGKVEQTPEQLVAENAEYLADITESFENVTYGDKTGRDLAIAIYSDPSIGFIADQAAKHIGDWANFSKPSVTS